VTSYADEIKTKQPVIDLRTAFFIWIALLSSVVISAAVVADFNLGYQQFQMEMAEHWVDYKPSAEVRSMANSGGISAATLEATYNKLAKSLNDVSVKISGSRVTNGVNEKVHGSGVIVAERYVLTNYHVVENAADFFINMAAPADTAYRARAQIILTDTANDLALLKVDTVKALPSATLGNSDTADAGNTVFAIGNAFGTGNVFTTGVICGRSETFYVDGREYRNMIRTETYMYPGSSGGPLADIKGEIIGINTAIYNPQGKFTGVSFAVPIKRAIALLKSGNVPGYGGAVAEASPGGYSLVA